jgi:PKD domain
VRSFDNDMEESTMKLRPALLVLVSLAILTLAAGSAQAQTSNFQGSTLGFSHNGDFSAIGSSCPGGANPTGYQWTFVEDGTTQTGNPVTHKFVTAYCAYTVQLKITCPGGATATKTRFACFSCGVSGCIFPDSGYN